MKLENVDKSGMKAGAKYVTSGLFYEFAKDKTQALFSIGPADYLCTKTNNIYPSLNRLYVQFSDPTEYHFANHYLLNLEHWRELSTHPLVLPYVEKWRPELRMKIKADAVQAIVAIVQSGSKDALPAAKYLLSTNEWFDYANKEYRGRGRPSNDRTSSIPVLDDSTVNDDFKRILAIRN